VGSNYWNFDTNKYSNSPIPQSVFDVPAGCTAHCNTTSMSYTERLARYFLAERTLN
jgi:hypothetical protein